MMRRAAARFSLLAMLLVCIISANVAFAEELEQRFVSLTLSGMQATPEQADWKAFLADLTALDAAGKDVTVHLARTYSQVGWDVRAVESWERYLAEGGDLLGESANRTDRERFQHAIRQLAFARYQQGLLENALGLYERWYELFPSDTEALRWQARIAQELGYSEHATELWREVAVRAPDDEGVQYFVTVSEEETAYGQAASQAFRAGIAAYEAGDPYTALTHFLTAIDANPNFRAPYEWAGRAAADAGLPELAYEYWQIVAEHNPGDERARWFVELSRTQARWGVEPTNAYYVGIAAYERGDLHEAVEAFEVAYVGAPSWNRALEWYARLLVETGRSLDSQPLWEELTSREPANVTARFYAQQATVRERVGTQAADLYDEGVRSDAVGDTRGALTAFSAAVAIVPEFVEAWEQLGLIYFAQGRYIEAAEAYEAALEIIPDNADYQFFYEQALRLAQR